MAFSNETQSLTTERKECINKIIASYDGLTSKMLEILLDVQNATDGKYISEPMAYYIAEQLGVKNLILYHTEDKNIARRKQLYTEEGRKYFHGNLYVPEDLEKIEL